MEMKETIIILNGHTLMYDFSHVKMILENNSSTEVLIFDDSKLAQDDIEKLIADEKLNVLLIAGFRESCSIVLQTAFELNIKAFLIDSILDSDHIENIKNAAAHLETLPEYKNYSTFEKSHSDKYLAEKISHFLNN